MSDDLLFKVRSAKVLQKSPSSDFLVRGGLDSVEWVQEVQKTPGAHVVLSVGAMSSSSGGVDPDHMVCRPGTPNSLCQMSAGHLLLV